MICIERWGRGEMEKGQVTTCLEVQVDREAHLILRSEATKDLLHDFPIDAE
jgi:hypothetical protein